MSIRSRELIHKYLHGIATKEEVVDLEKCLRFDTELQDEFLLQAEIDSHLRQEAQAVLGSPQAIDIVNSTTPQGIWMWISGVSTMVVAVLIAIALFSMPIQRAAMAHPSLGDLAMSIHPQEQNIWAASAQGDLEAVRRYLRNSFSVDVKAECGLTALHIATLANRSAVVDLLLENGADVSQVDHEGNTALHMASFLGRTEIVQSLLVAGADPTQRNKLGFSSLDNVAITWSVDLESYYHHVEQIINTTLDLQQIRMARPKILQLMASKSQISGNDAPPVSLWQAAITGNTAVVKQHIEAGTDVNAKEGLGGNTPLSLSAIFGQAEVAKILVEADADLNLQNTSGGTALHQASFFCRAEVVRLLIQAGADCQLEDSRGLTPLELASLEFDDAMEASCRHVYESLGLSFDAELVRETRTQIAKMLRDAK